MSQQDIEDRLERENFERMSEVVKRKDFEGVVDHYQGHLASVLEEIIEGIKIGKFSGDILDIFFHVDKLNLKFEEFIRDHVYIKSIIYYEANRLLED